MLKLYDQNKNPLGYIMKYGDDLCIESDLSNGDKSLSFTYLAKNPKDIKNEYYIETKDDRYVVKEVGVSSDGFPEFKCQLDLEDLEADMFENFSAMNCTLEDAANLALAGTGWTVNTEITKLRSVATMKATPLTILGKIRDAWMCEIQYDNKNKIVYFKNKLGEDKGVYFTRSLNLRKVELTSDSYDYYTRIIPIGADGLRITDVNGGKKYVENYQYSNKVRTLIWEDSSYEDAMALLEDAEKKLEDLSKPKKSYSADVVDLAKQNPNHSILSYSLGDTVLLLDERTGIKDKQRIVRLTEYPRKPENNSCELSNITLTFEEQQERLQAAADAVENITRADGTVNGVYVHGVEADGIVGIEVAINNSEAVSNINNQVSGIQTKIDVVNGELAIAAAKIGTLETTALTATTADLRYATIDRADILEGYVHNLEVDYGNFKTLTADEFAAKTAEIEKLSGAFASFKVGEFEILKSQQADFEVVTANKFTAQTAEIQKVSGELASFKTGEFEELRSQQADFEEATANNFTATNGQIENLSGEFASYKTTISQELIVAKGWMLEGSIGNAQISSIDATKIKSGIIDTSLLTVKGSGGKLQIVDNTMQISDANRVRVQVGRDASGDYSLAVWDSSGKLIWDALGATENTIQRKIIKDKMIADDAAIQALKIDFQSFETALTNQGVTISGTVVQVGNKILNIELTEQRNLITDQGELISDHSSKIEANETAIGLRVTSQEYETYKSYLSGQLTEFGSRMTSAESNITTLQGQISLKVEQTDITSAINGIKIGGRNLIRNSNFSDGTNHWQAYKATYSVGTDSTFGNCLKFATTTAGSPSYCVSHALNSFKHKTNTKYTLSFWAKASSSTTMASCVGNNHNKKTYSISTAWEKLTYTYTASAEDNLTFYPVSANVTIYLTNVKLEEGSKATDWTPAPEDVDSAISNVDAKFANYSTTTQMQAAIDLSKTSILSSVSETYATKIEVDALETWKSEASQLITKNGIISTVGNYYATSEELGAETGRITEAESQIKQHADRITSIVEDGGVISLINQTAGSVKIDAAKINLNGYVTMSDLSTAGKTTIVGDNIKSGTITGIHFSGATGDFTGSVTATNLIAVTTGKLSIFDFDEYGMSVDFTGNDVSDYAFRKDYFCARVFNGSNAERAYIYMDTEDAISSVKGRAIIYANDEISLRVPSTGIVKVLNESTMGNVIYINPNGDIFKKGYNLALSNGSKTAILRNDTEYFRIIIGDNLEDNAFTWNSLRPFNIDLSNGKVSINNGLEASSVVATTVQIGNSTTDGSLELYHATPFIDFHFGRDTGDFTSRIIEESKGLLRVVGNFSVSQVIYMGPDDGGYERSVRFKVTTGTNQHHASLYGGNPNSTTAIGCYDNKNGRGIWYYNDVSNYMFITPTIRTGSKAASWISSLKGAATIYVETAGSSSGFNALATVRASAGAWTMGVLNSDNNFYLAYGNETIVTGTANQTSKSFVFGSDGTIKSVGEIRVCSVQNAFRASYGNYGVIHRNDGTGYYILLTNSGAAETGTFNSLRPFEITLSTGAVKMNGKAVIPPSGDTAIRGNGDATHDCGHTSYLWKNVYSKNGVKTTSDEREKDIMSLDLSDLSDCFMSIKPIAFRWKYGNDKKIHLGVGAQTTERKMIEAGYDPYMFDMIQHDDLEVVSDSGLRDRYGINYQDLNILTMMQTQKNGNDIIALKEWKLTTDIELEVFNQRQDIQEERIRELEQKIINLELENERLKAALAS